MGSCSDLVRLLLDYIEERLPPAARAELDAAAKSADAKKLLAEGVKAESAAPGQAEAQVREAAAGAIE